MMGLYSLKVAEGWVAFDIVLLLEAIKFSWMHINSRQYLEEKTHTQGGKSNTPFL